MLSEQNDFLLIESFKMAECNKESDFSDLPGKPAFLNKEKTIVVFRAQILAKNVIQCLHHCIKAKLWAKNSRIVIASGFHTSENGCMGEAFSQFQGLIAAHFSDLDMDCASEIEEMSYKFESLMLLTYPKSNGTYELQDFALYELKSRMWHVLDSKDQHVFIFATCFSKESEVNNHFYASGLYPALLLSSERGLVTDGKDFQLDKQQQRVLRTFCEVRFFLTVKHCF